MKPVAKPRRRFVLDFDRLEDRIVPINYTKITGTAVLGTPNVTERATFSAGLAVTTEDFNNIPDSAGLSNWTVVTDKLTFVHASTTTGRIFTDNPGGLDGTKQLRVSGGNSRTWSTTYTPAGGPVAAIGWDYSTATNTNSGIYYLSYEIHSTDNSVYSGAIKDIDNDPTVGFRGLRDPDGLNTISFIKFFGRTNPAVNVLVDNMAYGRPAVVANNPPTISSPDSGLPYFTNVAENTTAVTNIVASDPDSGQTLQYTVSGADSSKFAISNAGALTFIDAPNYEAPTDAGQDNVYNILVNVSDGVATVSQDITVTVTNVVGLSVVKSGAILTVNDDTGASDNITFGMAGSNLVISNGVQLIDTEAGGTLSNGSTTLSITTAGITSLVVNGNGGNDTVTFDFSQGNPIPSGGITFNGGAGSDAITVTGGTTATVTHNFTSNSDGSVVLAGALAGTIDYTGLEPITDNLNAADRVFTFNGGTERINLTDAGGSSMTIDSTLGESVTFVNPTSSLTINAGTGDDTINLNSFNAGFTGALSVDGGTGTDVLNLNAAVTLAANKNVNLAADTINFASANADVTVSGTGTVTLTADKNVYLASGSSITSANGNVTIYANQTLPHQLGYFVGVELDGGAVTTTGTGNVDIRGYGGLATASVSRLHGVFLHNAAVVSSTSSAVSAGTINVDGRGAGYPDDALWDQSLGENHTFGVAMLNAGTAITSVRGAISVYGRGGQSISTGNQLNHGVYMEDFAAITSTGTGASAAPIAVTGEGGYTGSNFTYGVDMRTQAKVATVDGNVTITGAGSRRIGPSNFKGIVMETGAAVESTGAGNLTLVGLTTVHGTADNRNAIELNTGSRVVASGAGSITFDATVGVQQGTGYGVALKEGLVQTNNQPIKFIADGVLITSSATAPTTIDAGTSTVTFTTKTPGRPIYVSSAYDAPGNRIGGGVSDFFYLTPTAGFLALGNTELSRVRAGNLALGDGNNGSIFVTENLTRPAQTNLTLATSGSMIFNAGTSIDANGGNVSITTGAPGAIVVLDTSGTDVFADGLTIKSGNVAGNGIGSSTNPLRTSVNSLSTSSYVSGNQFIAEADNATLAAASAGSSTLTLLGGTFATAAGATILGNLTLNGATLAVGGEAVGSASGGSVTLPASYTATLNGTAPGTSYDQLSASSINLNGAALSLSLGFVAAPGAQFTIVNNTGAGAVTGTFSGQSEGSTLVAGGQKFSISYVGGTGNDVVLTKVAAATTFNATDDASFASAVGAAAPGDVINVAAGTYGTLDTSTGNAVLVNLQGAVVATDFFKTKSADGLNLGSFSLSAGGFDTLAANTFGSGSLSLPGLVVVTGTLTHTGGTTINGGSVTIGSGSIAGDIVNNGSIIVNRSDVFTYAGSISGSGALVLSGSGTLVLTGTNTYSGTTTVNSGAVLKIGAGATTGSLVSDVNNSGTVAFNRSNASTYAGNLTGVGTVNKFGAGTLTLTGTDSYGTLNINSGTVQVGAGGTAGSISGNVVDNGVLAFNLTGSQSFTGVVSGLGSLSVAGGVALTLNSASSYSGPTTITGNSTVTANLNNVLGPTSFVTVTSGSTLQLAGFTMTIGSLAGDGIVEDGAFPASTLTIGVNSAPSTTFSGVIRNGAFGPLLLVKQLASQLTLSGPNTYTGGTTITGVDTASGLGGGNLVNGGMLTISSDANLGDVNGGVNLNSLGTLRILAGFTMSSTRSLSLNSTTGNLNVAPGQTLTYNGTVTGSGGGLLKTGGGTLVLGGSNNNTGATAVIGGTLSISSDDALGGTSAGLRIGTGGTLEISAGFTMSSTRAITIGSSVSGSSVEVGTVQVDPGQTLVFNGSIGAGNASDTLIKTGTGTLSLGGSNSFNGGALINQGTVVTTSASALSSSAGIFSGITVATGATLQVGASLTAGSLAGDGTVLIDNGSTLTIGNNGKSTTFYGQIQQGAGSGGNLAKAGTGTMILTSASTYSGNTNVTGGVLQFNSPTSIGGSGSSVTVSSGASAAAGYPIDQAFVDRIGIGSTGAIALTSNSAVNLDFTNLTAATLGATAAVTYSGTITQPNGFYNLGGGGGTLTIVSGLTSSGNAVVVSGVGTVVLSSASNAFGGGTTVTNGSTLRFASAAAVPLFGSISVASGGVVAADFAIDQTFLNRVSTSSNGVVALGADSANNLSFSGYSALSLGAIGTYTYSGTLTPNLTAFKLGGGGGTLVVSSVLADNGGPTSLTVANNGTANGAVALTNANAYTGGTTVSSGSAVTNTSNQTYTTGLSIGNGGATGSILGNVTVNGNLTFNRSDTFTYGGAISGSGSVAQTGSGTTILTGNSSYTGGTLGLGGTLQFGDGVTVGTTFPNGSNNTNVIVFTATIAANPPLAGFNIAGLSRFRGTATSTFKKLGPNTMSIGQGQNVYWKGTIDVEGGVLTTNGNQSALGDQTSLVVNGGTLRTDFDGSLIQAPVFGSLAGAGGFFESGDPTPGLLTFGVNNANTSYAGVIQNGNAFSSSAVSSVVKFGTGTTTLTGTNTYTGSTVVLRGGLQLGDGVTAGTPGANTPISGITWSAGTATVTTTLGHFVSPGQLVTITGETPAGYNGTFLVLTTPSLTTFTYALPTDPGGTGGAGVLASTLYGNGTVTFNEPADITIGTSLAGSGTYVKQGPAVLTLSGYSTQVGPTQVASGTLRVDGSFAGVGTVAVTTSGATLGGSGTITGAVAVDASGGRITGAGVGSIGTLALNGGLTLANGSIGYFDVTNVTTKDLIAVTGNVTVSSGTANIAVPTGLADGIYTLVTYTGAVSSPSSFALTDLTGAAAPSNYTLTIGGGAINLVVGVNVTAVAPFVGPTVGGNTVIITGVGFTGVTAVKFGATDATSYTVLSTSQISAVAPAGVSTIDVSVSTAGSTSATNGAVDDYSYAVPAVDSVVINGGDIVARNAFGQAPVLLGQQSVVEQILVTFNMRVLTDSDAFNIASLAGSVTVLGIAPTASNVTVTRTPVAGTGNAIDGYTQYVLTFDAGTGVNTFSNPGSPTPFTTLKNGFFQLNTVGSKIHASSTPSATAADRADKFWALYGAVAAGDIVVSSPLGDGNDTLLVDGLALNGIYSTFGSFANVASPTYKTPFDRDLDGDVDGSDLNQLYLNFGTIWKV